METSMVGMCLRMQIDTFDVKKHKNVYKHCANAHDEEDAYIASVNVSTSLTTLHLGVWDLKEKKSLLIGRDKIIVKNNH